MRNPTTGSRSAAAPLHRYRHPRQLHPGEGPEVVPRPTVRILVSGREVTRFGESVFRTGAVFQ